VQALTQISQAGKAERPTKDEPKANRYDYNPNPAPPQTPE